MKNTNAGKLTVFAAAALSLTMLLGACGADTANSGNKSLTEEPAAGVDTSYTGELPMPDVNKRYDNPQTRDNIKDGGTYTVALPVLGPNWNYASNDGNSGYMALCGASTSQILWLTTPSRVRRSSTTLTTSLPSRKLAIIHSSFSTT